MRAPIDGGRLIAGRYALQGIIGRGGMSSVYRGRDQVLERVVALKPLGLLPGQDAPDLARAEREARLAARLDHAHVVAVFDLLEDDGEQWLVMEHVDGRNLAQLVSDRGPLPPDSAARLLGQAADALAAAHRAGIVHRDVKPSNILVTPEGQVKLTDFGIARAYSDPTLTATGLMTGSPAYLAPEVASGSPATAASDVWALGATMFHALTGEPPYDARDNVMGALFRIVNDDPPRPREAGWLAPVLERTMAKDPAGRWSMDQVRDRLLRRDGDGVPTRRVAPVEPHAAAVGTTRVTPVGAPVGDPVVRPAAAEPLVSSLRQAPRDDDRSGRFPGGVLWAALALLVAAIVGGAYLLADREEPVATGAPDGGTRSEATQDPGAEDTPEDTPEETPEDTPEETPEETPEDTPEETPDAATEEPGSDADRDEMAKFVEGYYETVTEDPETTWALLTPAYQAATGGYDDYTNYWSTIAEAKAKSIEADPDQGSVTFVMESKRTDDSKVEEVVTLLLERSDDGYLIAGQR